MIIYQKPLAQCNERPGGAVVNTLIIHSMCADEHPGQELEVSACIRQLEEKNVSAHYVISREGEIWQLVDEAKRAWHAGESKLPEKFGGARSLNDFSIGVELVAFEHSSFTEQEYQALVWLTLELLSRHPIRIVLGHDIVAQPSGRKSDPGRGFDWKKYQALLHASGRMPAGISFPDA
jgi:N-acetyl-anhydromuramyl-L-alanine amidase AmpD